MAGGVAGSTGLEDTGLLGTAVRRAKSFRAFSIWIRSERRDQKSLLAQPQGRPFTPHLMDPCPGGPVCPAQVHPSTSKTCAGHLYVEPAGRQCSEHREGTSHYPPDPQPHMEFVGCPHGGRATLPWETGASLTLGDIRLRARASTSCAVASVSVVGGRGSSAGSMSGTSSTLKRGCQRVSRSSGTTMGGFREARNTYPRRGYPMTLSTSGWGGVGL